LVLILFSCQETEEEAEDTLIDTSTLDENLSGQSSSLDEIFFNFNNELDYSYDYYSVAGIGYANTIENECLIRDTDKLNLYTFPNYLVEGRNCDDPSVLCEDEGLDYNNYVQNYLLDETYGDICTCECIDEDGDSVNCGANSAIGRSYNNPSAGTGVCQNEFITEGECSDNISESEIECCGNNDGTWDVQSETCDTSTEEWFSAEDVCVRDGWIWFPETIDCSLLDVNEDCVMEEAQESDLLNIQNIEFSLIYTNLDQLEWDGEAGRYKPVPSEDQEISVSIIDSSDTYNVSNYWTIINEWENIDGMVYVDHSQWNDTTLIIPEDPPEGQDSPDIVIDTTFTYTRTILGPDSLMFRINSDCNNDGQWTEAEEFDDTGDDGCFDDNETGFIYLLDENGGLNFVDGSITNEQDLINSYTCGECQLNTINVTNPDYFVYDGNNIVGFTSNAVCGSDPNGDNWIDGFNDPLIYKDGNGIYELGENFTDRNDNLLIAEIYYDVDGNGTKNGLEPFVDRNCNGSFDAEIGVNDGNGIWDDGETFLDTNFNGEWDNNEYLYSTSQSPNQIILNYDTNGDNIVDEFEIDAPEIVSTIDPEGINSVMVYVNGGYEIFTNMISEQPEESYQFYKYTPIEELVTVFSNEIVEDIPADLTSNDYFVTKTLWDMSNTGVDVDGDGIPDRDYDYDYHLFRYSDSDDSVGEGHLMKLIHPAYYYHYGYFETPSEIEEGFYETSDLIEDVMIYTVGGMIREGEKVSSYDEAQVDSNNDGVIDMEYEINKEFEVFFEEVPVPVRQVLGIITEEGGDGNTCSEGAMITCAADGLQSCIDAEDTEYAYNSCGEEIEEISDCSADTLFNAYKVVTTREVKMIGNGVEFGERNTIWLANGHGIIRDKLEHRWTEQNGIENWSEYSRLELKSSSNQNDALGRLFNGCKILHFDDFENEGSFNNDPFRITPTAIIQRSRNSYD